ncbi:MAG: Xaa-Pro peptidase family protein [Lachnospiraceae bacterium]|nr:Xaa-Pro peptidase family protein [Lachnospiraceae bacterium]
MDRLEQLRARMEEKNLDGFYIAKQPNVRCISGFTGEYSSMFITRRGKYMITDPRYTEQASLECPDYPVVDWRNEYGYSKGKAIAALARQDEVKAIGFEADYLTYEIWHSLQEELEAELVPTVNVIEELRAVKTPEEVQNLRISCDIASRAFERIVKDLRVGVTEKEIASRLMHYMVMEGADTKPYGGIVLFGARTSLLHGIPGARSLEYGDFVLMDYGCQYHGYLSDMTRTLVVGKADARQREVYGLCRQMTEDTETFIRPGVTGAECYEASLEAIRDTEYMPYHYSGIGHSVGLFVHEVPMLGPTWKSELAVNHVLTVEPGIYIPGWGGVRVEDQGLITESGYEILTSATHELLEL